MSATAMQGSGRAGGLAIARLAVAGLAVAGLALLLAWWWMVGADDSPRPSPQPAAAVRSEATPFVALTASLAEAAPLARARAPSDSSPACAAQSIRLALGAMPPEPRCATPTSTRRSGETLIHEVQTIGGNSAWTLRAETIGPVVHRLTLTSAQGTRYGCSQDEAGCAGVSFDQNQPNSTHRIVLADTPLRVLPPQRPKGMRAADFAPAMVDADATAAPIRVSAALAVPAVDESACAGEALALVASSGQVSKFCADAGNEQGSLPGGGEHIGYLPYAGPALRIRVDGHGRVLRVEMGSLACEGGACTGVAIEDAEPGAPPGLRSIAFAGTTLMPSGTGGSAESVVVNGRLPMP